MPKTDEGEFELILGNKQLISVFLIVVVLLGVFFSMGYIVGRNSAAPAPEVARNTTKSAPVEPPPSEPQPQAASPSPSPAEPPTNPAEVVSKPTGPETTHPEQSAPAPKPAAKPAPVTPPPVTVAKPKPSAIGPASVRNDIPSGQYWQVAATARPDAEILSEALNKKGFHSQVAPGPREGVFRVLVGPFSDSSTQAQARTKLEAAGFKGAIMRKY